MAAIELRKITKSFGPTHVIKGVDLAIEKREFVVFVGPSGCGKSTLLRLVAGLEDISSGTLLMDGETVNDLPPAERRIAMVFQSYALYPHMSVYENMAFGMKLAKADREEVDRRVRASAKILQIEHLLDRKPKALSGGQRQRVAIGRAITRNPRIFLFDEPLSNLDAALRVQMRIEIAKLHHELDATMIYVTHDQIEAMTLADRIVVLSAGEVMQFGSPLDLYHHPDNKFVAGFIGSPKMNFLEGEVAGNGGDGLGIRLPGGGVIEVPLRNDRPSGKVEVGLRPEHLLADGGGDAELEAKVITVEQLGAESYVYADLGMDEPLVVKAAGSVKALPGETIRVGVPAAATYLFDSAQRCYPRNAFI